MGVVDILTALYFGGVLAYKNNDVEWMERDRLVLSAGHWAPSLYATLAKAGFFDRDELFGLRSLGSRLQGHPHYEVGGKRNLPGIENVSGSLGQGVSMAVGVALGLRMRHEKKMLEKVPRVIVLGSDGELQEGMVWEAYMTASKYKLEHLTFVIDRNHIQIGGHTEEVMPIDPLREKLESFGLFVVEVDGHNIRSLIDVFSFDQSVQSRPVAIIAHTIPGKGVSFMEDDPEWHGKAAMGEGEAVEALRQLRTLQGKIEGGHLD
jgi:transketolase